MVNAVDVVMLPNVPRAFKCYVWECVAGHFDRFTPVPEELSREQRTRADGDPETSEKNSETSDPDPGDSDGNRKDRTSCLSHNGGVEKVEGSGKLDGATQKPVPIEQRLNPLFPNLWELALAQDAVKHVLSDILDYSNASEEDLIDLVLQYLEPRIEQDDDVTALIKLLANVEYEYVLRSPDVDRTCSARAIRLFALFNLENK